MKVPNLGVLFIFGLTVPSARAAAVDDPAFISLGVGASSHRYYAMGSLSAKKGPILYTLRTSLGDESNLFGPVPDEGNRDHGVLVGHLSHRRGAFVAVSAGLAATQFIRRGETLRPPSLFWWNGEYRRVETWTVGVPLDLKVGLASSRVGVVVNAYGNLNTRHSFAGYTVSLIAGKLR